MHARVNPLKEVANTRGKELLQKVMLRNQAAEWISHVGVVVIVCDGRVEWKSHAATGVLMASINKGDQM